MRLRPGILLPSVHPTMRISLILLPCFFSSCQSFTLFFTSSFIKSLGFDLSHQSQRHHCPIIFAPSVRAGGRACVVAAASGWPGTAMEAATRLAASCFPCCCTHEGYTHPATNSINVNSKHNARLGVTRETNIGQRVLR